MKPGQMANIDNPQVSQSTGIADAQRVAMGSNQTSATTQVSADPNRMRPAQEPAGPSGVAEVERDGVMPNQTSNYTDSAKTRDAKRAKIFR